MPETTKKIKIRAISDAKELVHLKEQWNAIVDKSSNNPFLLFSFVRHAMHYKPKGWTPLILILSEGKRVIGIAPLKMRSSFGERSIEFLQSDWCSDFIFDKSYRETCVKSTCEFILKILKCNRARFVFPHDSPNLSFFWRYCKLVRTRLEIYPEKGRRIIPFTSSWTEFEAKRSRNFRKQLRRQKRNLGKAGSWRVTCIEGNKQSEVSRRIIEVEKKSWKEIWRSRRGKKDWNLGIILKASNELSERQPDFRLRTWFLELEDKTIAYLIEITYKKVVYLVKTSYDNRYRKTSPGLIMHYSVIEQLFEEKQNEYIDFLSNLKYLRVWTKKYLPRFGIMIAKGILPEIILFLKQKFRFALRSSPFLSKKVNSFLSRRTYDSRFNDFLDLFL